MAAIHCFQHNRVVIQYTDIHIVIIIIIIVFLYASGSFNNKRITQPKSFISVHTHTYTQNCILYAYKSFLCCSTRRLKKKIALGALQTHNTDCSVEIKLQKKTYPGLMCYLQTDFK